METRESPAERERSQPYRAWVPPLKPRQPRLHLAQSTPLTDLAGRRPSPAPDSRFRLRGAVLTKSLAKSGPVDSLYCPGNLQGQGRSEPAY